jgi:MFS family permease
LADSVRQDPGKGTESEAMLAWFGELNVTERRTMGACFGGWALDAFDVQMYSFVIPTVIALWGVSRGEAGLIGTVTLLISSLGGWFSGTLADRFGRVRMLQITILWYSIFTFLCAFAQNFEQLFVLRALHGLGFGGEWAAGAVLMGEVIRDKYRGRGVGIVQTGWAVGWGASALIYTALYAFLPEAIAWRVLFAIGLLPAIFVFWIRRHIDEPEIFRAPAAHSSDSWGRPPVFRLSWTVSADHNQSHLDGRRRARRRLCPLDLDADLSAGGTGVIGDRHGRISVGPDLGCIVRLSVGFVSERRHRPQMDLYAVGDRLARDDPHLHVCTDGQHRTPVRRYPAFHNIPDEIPANGAVHD